MNGVFFRCVFLSHDVFLLSRRGSPGLSIWHPLEGAGIWCTCQHLVNFCLCCIQAYCMDAVGNSMLNFSGVYVSHMLPVHLPAFTINLGDFCRQIYHTWIIWVFLGP